MGPASMMDHIKLKRAENGYMVCVSDPAIVKANEKSTGAWKDPERQYVFETLKAAMNFIEAVADKALPKDETKDPYADAFDAAAETEDNDDAD